jgi:VWFA-related protein
MRHVAKLMCLAALSAMAQDQPVIRVGTRLVQVDVIVRNKNGPVTDLAQTDFKVFDKGKQQRIALFRLSRAAVELIEALPPGVVSNRANLHGEAVGSATAVILDRVNTASLYQPYANGQVMKFLRSLGPRDRVGIFVLGRKGVRVLQDFTGDVDRLSRALGRLNPEESLLLETSEVESLLPEPISTGNAEADRAANEGSANGVAELGALAMQYRVDITTEAFATMARHMEGIPGRKGLVWISSSFPLTFDLRGAQQKFTDNVARASQALNQANVAVYPVDARGLMAPSLVPISPRPGQPTIGNVGPSGVDSMLSLAAATGGRAFYNTNDIRGAVRQAMDDAEVTYTLGFYPAEAALDGTFHNINVEVARRGTDLRYRKGYLAPKEQQQSLPQRRRNVRALLSDPLDATALALAAAANPDPSGPGQYLVRIWLAVNELHLDRKNDLWRGSIEVAMYFETKKTRPATSWTFPIAMNDDQLRSALANGFVIQKKVDTSSESGRLHIAVQDQSTGAAGSVSIELSVAKAERKP